MERLIGKRIAGVLGDNKRGTVGVIFDDGTAIVFKGVSIYQVEETMDMLQGPHSAERMAHSAKGQ